MAQNSAWPGPSSTRHIEPSATMIKPVLATIEQRLILRKLGALQGDDVQALRSILRQILR